MMHAAKIERFRGMHNAYFVVFLKNVSFLISFKIVSKICNFI